MSSGMLSRMLYQDSLVCKDLSDVGVGSLCSLLKALGYCDVDVEKGIGYVGGIVDLSSSAAVKSREEEVEKVEKSRVLLPWCGLVLESNCVCLKLNSGLYTQCSKLKLCGKEYCSSCEKSISVNGGSSVYGCVKERLKVGLMDYKDPKGKVCVPYGNVMKKLNITREEAEKEAGRLGWTIPECQFEEKVGKRGRPKKDVCVDDTSSECSEKKKRGRPKKEKEVVSNTVGDDLIASLLTSQTNVEENEQECEVSKEEEEEETQVVKFEFNGKCYLKSEDNILFDIESHDAVGLWNDETNEINELPDEDEDEDEDE